MEITQHKEKSQEVLFWFDKNQTFHVVFSLSLSSILKEKCHLKNEI